MDEKLIDVEKAENVPSIAFYAGITMGLKFAITIIKNELEVK